jgi:nucleotidyltransferase/DNA polymerase involved in DNA repair
MTAAPRKLASDQRKPNGQYVVPPGKGEAFVQGLPIGRFYGVGAVTEAKMKRLGVHTGEDLHRQSLTFLQQHFGKSGLGTTPSRAARIIDRSMASGCASPRVRRRRSRPT